MSSPVYTITNPTGIPLSNSTITTSNITWTSPVYTVGTMGTDGTTTPRLEVKGDAHFDGDVKIQGKSITETIQNIERRLAILHPNPKLEEKWERLKALGDMYRELEKEIIEKEGIWATLKK